MGTSLLRGCFIGCCLVIAALSPSASPPANAFNVMTLFDSPNCVVRSLEQQLAATHLASDDDKMAENSKPESSAAYKTPTKKEEESLQEPAKSMIQLPTSLQIVRNLIFQLCAITGSLSSLFWQKMPLDRSIVALDASPPSMSSSTTAVPDEVVVVMVELLQQLMNLSTALALDLGKVCYNKIGLNNRKYPVNLCKGRAGKYTQYSNSTGITKHDGQSTVDHRTTTNTSSVDPPVSSATSSEWRRRFVDETVTGITLQTRQFAVEREWEQYHTPRNLLLALTGELGELAELFQWKGDTDDPLTLSLTEHDKVGQELADVTIYLCRLADVCGVSLSNEMPLK